MIDEESERHEIEALLPWYAAGTLSRREADLVERVLAGDSKLARRYDVVRQELTETIQLNETLATPSARAMEKLFAAIDAEEAAAPRDRPRRISRTPSLATTSTMNNDAPGGSRVRAMKVREAQ
jgi:anti-sigma-K factor RskA